MDNDWVNTSPVRFSLLRYTKPALTNLPFTDLPWHLPSAASKQLFLSHNRTLSATKDAESNSLEYQADTAEEVEFTYDFPSRTALVGPATLVVNVKAPDHDDLDIYTHIFKAAKDGTILSNKNIPTPDTLSAEEEAKVTRNRLFRYWGPDGLLRASKRHVDPEKSTKTWKTLSHEHIQKLKPGELIRLEIQLWPTGIVFEAGEKLILKISGERMGVLALPFLQKDANPNVGKHVLFVGGEFDSHLQFYTTDVLSD